MSTQSGVATVEAQCMKCRQIRPMKDPQQSTMKNDRPFIKGTCQVCGTKMSRIGTISK